MFERGTQKGTAIAINGSVDGKDNCLKTNGIQFSPSLTLDESLLTGLRQSRYIRWTPNDNSYKVNSIDWSSSGDRLIISSDESIVRIFDMNGVEVSVIPSKKHGSDCVQWMADTNTAVFASRYESNNGSEFHKIRHLDINTKTFLHYYCGHERQVTGLSINYFYNCFLSSSLDSTIRLWDSRLSAAIKPGDRRSFGVLRTQGRSVASFDPKGVIFAMNVGIDSSIRLYDMRNYTKGPFKVSKLDNSQHFGEVHGLKFSPNGQLLALSTNGVNMRIINAFTLQEISVINGYKNDLKTDLQLTWTPDSNYLFCGSSGSFAGAGNYGNLNLFSARTGSLLKNWKTMHESFTRIVSFNPIYYMLASACHDIAYWCPSKECMTK